MSRILQRKIIVDPGTTGRKLICAWDECDDDALTLHEVRVRMGERLMHYAFCSERHRQYWLACSGRRVADTGDRHGGRVYGNLPPGYKTTVL